MSAHLARTPASTFPAAAPATATLRTLWHRFRQAYLVALREETSRRNLRVMDDRMLSDIGVSRAQAHYEADRKPWHLM